MTTQFEDVTSILRQRILNGSFALDTRLAEIPLAKEFGVSRTPVRLALGELEKEGLIYQQPRRGFRVRSFSTEDVVDAIDVRGNLEGMAGRLIAQSTISEDIRDRLQFCLNRGENLLKAGSFNATEQALWVDNNVAFHTTIVDGSDNRALSLALEHVNRMPLASPAAIVFETADKSELLRKLGAAHNDHVKIYAAIDNLESDRAEFLLREHAYISRENKIEAFRDIQTNAKLKELPGAELIRAS
jgi:GntR family transcriptional regulator of vanillate catabolism